ncbi:MAG: alkaline phosphatase family protein [Candidatus Omnitrophica bacterium]|nr:alkaline phosphatase family protein [Candidatus Omnitrophota bacterium]
MKKVLVIGLDCAPPSIVFERRREFPTLNRLMREGCWAKFRTCHPPITIPAWMAMCTSRTAGDMGTYGFRHRKGRSYKEIDLSFSDKITTPAIWDIIAKNDMPSCLVGVPPGFPPKKINGNLISCFMTPDADREYTYPHSLKQEIEARFGKYIFDVRFRTEDRDKLLKGLYDMTRQHFDAISYLIKNKPWRFFMFVEIGVDRANHAFWKFFDKSHNFYSPGNKYENAIIDYYKFLDDNIAKLLALLDDDTIVFVVSDHGAKAMKGAFCINQWLIEKGYLVLKNNPAPGSSLEEADVDWSRTKAWGWGGYYARIFLNVKGREDEGSILPFRYEAWREKLKKELQAIKGPGGEHWNTKAYRPNELFKDPKGNPADLIVYLDDLSWRSAGTLGHESIYLPENDKGPDDAVHDWDGIFIMHDPKREMGKDLGTVSIFDLAPTALDLLGVDVPKEMEGKSLLERSFVDV